MNLRHIKSKTYLLLFILFTSINLNAQLGQIIWEDNFSSFDTTLWNKTIGDGCPDLCGWGNNELEFYKNENVYIEEIPGEPGNFALVLEAKKETEGNSSFTSGKVTTENKLGIKYGMIELRIKVPDNLATGLWPAAWMLGTNMPAEGWPACGEIDIMEMGQSAKFRSDKGIANANENDVVGANLIWYSEDACSSENQDCAASIAFDNYYCTPYKGDTPLTSRFQTYRMYWDDKQIRFTVEDEGKILNLYTGPFPLGAESSEFTKPFYFIMNLAVGGNFTDAATSSQVTATLPGKMYIDYIRVRKWNGKGEVFTPNQLMANAGANRKYEDGSSVSLNAAGSYGPIDKYNWYAADTLLASGINANVSLNEGTHTISLIISDNNGNTATDDITLEIGDNDIGEVIWLEDFTTLDTNLWNYTIGDGCDEGLCGWGNNELQYYNNDNVYIEEISGDPGNYALVLEAKKESINESEFTSGKVTTEGKVAIQYGVIEVRMKTPDVESGLWPAAWLLGINHRTAGWPQCGEIDMMEMGHSVEARQKEGFNGSVNNFVAANAIWYSSGACSSDNQSCAASIAYDAYYNTPYTPSTGMHNRYMTYRLYWDDSQIRFVAVDNNVEYDLYTNPFPFGANIDAFRKPFYFLLDLAVGGNFTGLLNPEDITAPLPGKLYIDYVKVSKWKGQGNVTVNGESILANAGADITITDLNKDGKETVTLDASGCYGSISEYIWSENGAQIAKGKNPTIELSSGTHFIELTAVSNSGKSSTDVVKVDIQEIVWEENFNDFNSAVWNKITGNGCPDLCGWGNNELEYYKEENLSIAEIENEPGNSGLVIEAKKEQVESNQFTSGKITTLDKLSIKYGLIEVRMKVPDNLATGLWPAAWLLGINEPEVGWPECGEIDMMEMGQSAQFRYDKGLSTEDENNVVGANLIFYSEAACSGDNPNCAASIAYDNYYCTPYSSATNLTDRFLTYRTYWDNNQIRLAVEDNGVEYDFYTGPFPIGADAQEYNNPFYFILNLAVGGNFTDAASTDKVTATLPGKMIVDYVRVLKWNGKGEVAFEHGIVANAGSDIIIVDKDGDGIENVILDASESNDHNGSITNYNWSLNGSTLATSKTAAIELNRGKYSIVLTVTDNDGNTATDTVNVSISSGGLSPIAHAGNDTTLFDINENDSVTYTLDASKSEAAGAPLNSFKWILDEKELASGVSPTVKLKTGIHNITLFVTDEDSLTGTDEVIVTVIDSTNNLPIANAGDNIIAYDEDGDDIVTISLDASGSTDSDGSIENYSWQINETEIASGITTTIDLSTGFHLITLEVIDNDGASGFDQVSATIIDPDNIAPVANAGKDTIVVDIDNSGSENFELDASASSDNDGSIEQFNWYTADTIIANKQNATVILPVGEHPIILEATDDDGDSGSDTVNIIVNQLPVAHAGNDTLVYDNDTNGIENIVLDGSKSYDPNDSIVSYSWVHNNTEIANEKTSAFDFEKGTHEVTLMVTDTYGNFNTDLVKITMARLNNIPPVANAGPDIVQEDADNNGQEMIDLNGLASTDEDGLIYEYLWINNNDTIATGPTPAVVLEVGDHFITLKVTDDEGATATDEIAITVAPSACYFPACTGDFTARIISDSEGTSIKFIPTEFGIGENMCYFYYGTSDPMPAHFVTPYETYKMNDVNAGDNISFYFTYSTSTTEQSTYACKDNFVVGECTAAINNDPMANAGKDQTIEDTDNDGKEDVTLDATASTDADGTITAYSWYSNGNKIASGENPTIKLSRGTHEINLLVHDDSDNISRDAVKITINEADPSGILAENEKISVYPSPTNSELNIYCNEEIIQSVWVINNIGIKVMEAEFTSKIDVSHLPEGVYYLQINTNKDLYLSHFIKM